MKLTPFCTPCRTGKHLECVKPGGLWLCECTHRFTNGSESRISDRLTFALRYLELAAIELQEFAPPELADRRESLKRSYNTLASVKEMLWFQLEQKERAA